MSGSGSGLRLNEMKRENERRRFGPGSKLI